MDMPKPTKFHKKLAAFEGKWSGKEIIHPTPWDPAGGKAKGSMRVEVGLDGLGIVQDYVQKRDGKVCYRGHGVMGYDAAEKCYVWHWSDTMGGVPAATTRGTWDKQKLVFQHGGAHGHQRYTYTFHRDGTLGFSIESSENGSTWTPFIEARYEKKGD